MCSNLTNKLQPSAYATRTPCGEEIHKKVHTIGNAYNGTPNKEEKRQAAPFLCIRNTHRPTPKLLQSSNDSICYNRVDQIVGAE